MSRGLGDVYKRQVHMVALRCDAGSKHIADGAQLLIILPSDAPSRLRPLLKIRQLNGKHRPLQSVHAAIDTFEDMLSFPPMTGKGGRPVSQSVIIRYKSTRISVSSQVLTWIERERRSVSEGADEPSIELCK